jgi:hypothetical protein
MTNALTAAFQRWQERRKAGGHGGTDRERSPAEMSDAPQSSPPPPRTEPGGEPPASEDLRPPSS